MNRQIKFRGKSADGKWHYGDLLHIDGGTLIYHGSHTESDDLQDSEDVAVELLMNEVAVCLPDTIGQFTGLTDHNGKGIYEGDLIKDNEFAYEVFWCDDVAAFMVEEYKSECDAPKIWLLSDFCKECEVIGNIYDDKIKEE